MAVFDDDEKKERGYYIVGGGGVEVEAKLKRSEIRFRPRATRLAGRGGHKPWFLALLNGQLSLCSFQPNPFPVVQPVCLAPPTSLHPYACTPYHTPTLTPTHPLSSTAAPQPRPGCARRASTCRPPKRVMKANIKPIKTISKKHFPAVVRGDGLATHPPLSPPSRIAPWPWRTAGCSDPGRLPLLVRLVVRLPLPVLGPAVGAPPLERALWPSPCPSPAPRHPACCCPPPPD